MKPKENTWFETSGLIRAGLMQYDSRVLYTRNEVETLWDSLDAFYENDFEVLFAIHGAPGVGKSCNVWKWMCHKAVKEDVLWIHLNQSAKSKCVRSTAGQFFGCSVNPDQVCRIILESKAKMIAVDGYTNETSKLLVANGAHFEILEAKKVVFVCSQAVSFTPAHFGLHAGQSRSLELQPWVLDQYLRACENILFLKSLFLWPLDTSASDEKKIIQDAKRLVNKRFYYAGASARWMFEYDLEGIKREIKYYIAKVNNYSSLMAVVTGTTDDSLNHLIMNIQNKDRNNIFFVSQCALDLCLQQWNHGTDIQYAYFLARKHKNPMFTGWVVRFDFIDQIRRLSTTLRDSANKLAVHDMNGGIEEWLVSGVTEFDSTSSNLDGRDWQKGQWMLPILWNQAGYDAACLCESDSGDYYLKIVQITCGNEHNLKIDVFATLLSQVVDALGKNIPGLEIVILMPTKVETPKLNSEGEGLLDSVRVGNGPATWQKMKETDQVVYRCFLPCSEVPP